jgi:hypothetical protein
MVKTREPESRLRLQPVERSPFQSGRARRDVSGLGRDDRAGLVGLHLAHPQNLFTRQLQDHFAGPPVDGLVDEGAGLILDHQPQVGLGRGDGLGLRPSS